MQEEGEKRVNGDKETMRERRDLISFRLFFFFCLFCVLIRALPFPSGQGRGKAELAGRQLYSSRDRWTPSLLFPSLQRQMEVEEEEKKEGKWDSGECACDPIGH